MASRAQTVGPPTFINQPDAAPQPGISRQRAHQLAAYLADALDLSAEQRRQVERCTYVHLRQQQRTAHHLLDRLPGAQRRAERRYLASLGRVLRPSQLATYFWLADQQPMAVVRLSSPRF
ncbi:hypothetical protein HER32_09500 [Hymenobacter sp. BT18]|uniref:hypothetical protein n=1 Tax=Hymenobacter sp. BT18 TaxID=2835648 RepID=UPI00143E44DC|nr:hypothetical protein [Hymenobacter sp. BT18]QIX61399.1 hypothetical protein HER32_09500 [Hymenobacter sp. BT18]